MLDFKEEFLQESGAIHTATEIIGQPSLWSDCAAKFYRIAEGLENFLTLAYAEVNDIIFTGAGTSAFIGLSLEGSFYRNTGIISRTIPTTDIVSHPQDYFGKHQTSLIISFARSGNSPESYAALKFADEYLKKCYHLIITCDERGALATFQSTNPVYTFLLPEQANDKSLAMTGSYSTMLLTGLLTAYLKDKQLAKRQVARLQKAASNIFTNSLIMLRQIVQKDIKRAIFLGSGPLFGTAAESALKLQELTDGNIICKADTYLGLRHGPKSVVDENTLVVYLLSNSAYPNRYEHDLVQTMQNGNKTLFRLSVSEWYQTPEEIEAQINFGSRGESILEDFMPVCVVLVGQLLGFYKSLQLGLRPDEPSVTGSISRVVNGVTIYPQEILNDQTVV